MSSQTEFGDWSVARVQRSASVGGLRFEIGEFTMVSDIPNYKATKLDNVFVGLCVEDTTNFKVMGYSSGVNTTGSATLRESVWALSDITGTRSLHYVLIGI
jgi:hypothetical protein